MILKNDSDVELVSHSVVNKEEVREQYTLWLNDLDAIQSLGGYTMLYPKVKEIVDDSFVRFTSNDCIGFFIRDKNTNTFIGTCKLDKISISDRSTEIGIMIAENSARGKGVGKQVYRLLLEYAFEVLGMKRVWGVCHSTNIGSEKLFESTGFKYEGRARKAVFRRGEYLDILQYSILREEYFI